jgi:D-alanine-D-alanine ligase
MKKIAVLMGGTSSEREVSLESGRNVSKALASLGRYEVIDVVLDADSLATMPAGVDAAYIALHGGWGENGGVQSALDKLGIPYTGPGAKACAIAMDKIATKRILDEAGIATPPWRAVTADEATREGGPVSPGDFPAVVKIPRDGSSVGVFLVHDEAEYREAVRKCVEMDGREALVEAYVPGREATVGVIGGECLPPLEIVAKNGWYGYDEKYRSNETRYPFLEDADLCAKLCAAAKATWDAIGCRGVSRIDFRVAPDGTCHVLELNSSPGFTSHSLVPKASMATGATFAETCERILSLAECD